MPAASDVNPALLLSDEHVDDLDSSTRERCEENGRRSTVDRPHDLDDLGAEEGGVLLKQHLRRERDPKLKASKLADAKKRGIAITCESCGFDFYATYGQRGLDYIECHHRTPLGVSGKVKTRLVDLALICSNCHRMMHRTKQWLTVEALRELVDQQRTPSP